MNEAVVRPIDYSRDEAELKAFLVEADKLRLDTIRPAVESGDCLTLVFECQGRTVGWAVLHLRYRSDLGWTPGGETIGFQHGEDAYLENIEIIQALRGQGIGRKLLAGLEAEAVRLGKTTLWLHTGEKNKGAHNFYSREGWAHHSTVYPEWKKGAPVRIYQKKLLNVTNRQS